MYNGIFEGILICDFTLSNKDQRSNIDESLYFTPDSTVVNEKLSSHETILMTGNII